jgi:hypothetical protein
MARGDIRQRISLEGGEEVRRQLQQMGVAGERAAHQIGGAMAAQGGNFANLDRAMLGSFNTIGLAAAKLAPAKAAFTDLHAHAGRFGNSLDNIASVLVPAFANNLKFGLGAAAAGLAVAFGKMTTNAARGITELNNLSKVSSFSIKTLEGLKDVFKGVVDRDDIGKSVVQFSQELGKARLEAAKTQNEVTKNVTTMRGSVTKSADEMGGGFRKMAGDVELLRSAGRQLRDTSNIFKSVNLDITKFADTEAGNEAALIAFSKALSAIPDKTEKARIGVEAFGRQWAIMGAAFLDLDKTLPAAMLQNLKAGLGITPKMLADAQQYRMDVADLGDAWEETSRKVGSTLVPALTFAVQKTGESFVLMRDTVGAFGVLMTAIWEKIYRDYGTQIDAVILKTQEAIPLLQGAWQGYIQFQLDTHKFLFDAITEGWTAVASVFKAAWDSVVSIFSSSITSMLGWLQGLIDKAYAAAAAIGSIFGGGGGGTPAATAPIPPGNAQGGYIRGAGTATSDSILARLSDGEYVVRAAAVKHFGVGVFEALNRLHSPKFAMGGLADAMNTSLIPRSRRYRSGGLVAAGSGGGAPVYLQIHGGKAIGPMISDKAVLGALHREAKRAKVFSAGRAPSSVG